MDNIKIFGFCFLFLLYHRKIMWR